MRWNWTIYPVSTEDSENKAIEKLPKEKGDLYVAYDNKTVLNIIS